MHLEAFLLAAVSEKSWTITKLSGVSMWTNAPLHVYPVFPFLFCNSDELVTVNTFVSIKTLDH